MYIVTTFNKFDNTDETPAQPSSETMFFSSVPFDIE